MILTPEEQTEYREEIDHLIETRGYEYIWGKETAMDKTKGLIRDAPAKIAEGLQKIATNPTVISINEKLAAHAAKLDTAEAQERNVPMRRERQPMRQMQNNYQPPYHEHQQHNLKKKKKRPPEPEYDYNEPEPSPFSGGHPFGEHPLGKHPLGENPMQRKGSKMQGDKMQFGGDHL